MAVDLKRRSRLRFANLRLVDGIEFWDLVELPTLSIQPDDTVYVVAGNDRIDLIANKFYGDPVLWWVIALANDLELLPSALNEGTLLRIPAPRYILQVLFAKTVQ